MPIPGLQLRLGTGVWGLGIAGEIIRAKASDYPVETYDHILTFKIYLLPLMVTGFYRITRWK
jgi:hypothetical protein